MRGSLAAATILAAVTLTACASMPTAADRAFDARDYATAAAGYERALAAKPKTAGDDRLRFRLALAYLLPDSPVQDAARAQALLADLATHPPVSPYRDAAAFILGLENALATAQAAADAFGADLSRRETEAKALEGTIRIRDDALQRQRATLADLQAQIHRLQEELQQLKNIDLRRKR